TSASRGTLARIRGSAVRSDAAMSFRAAFLAPLMGISPFSGCPPRMRIRSMANLVAGAKAQGKAGKKRGYPLLYRGFWAGLGAASSCGSARTGLGGLRRLRLARNAAASFSGEDLAIKNPLKRLPERRGWKSERPAFLRGILTL